MQKKESQKKESQQKVAQNVEQLDKNVRTISAMFDSIAPVYDKLNTILSFGVDRRWRKRLLKNVKATSAQKVLDLACGSGDVSIALHRAGLDVTGGDISEGMLQIARKKSPEDIRYLYANAADLPFEDATFDCITISFGIRNFDQLDTCVKELFRVLKPGGTIQILEFGIPRNPIWRGLYTFYFRHILPLIGRCLSGDKGAYTYLPESSFAFPYGDDFCKILVKGGFKAVSNRSMTGGIAYLYNGVKSI